MDGSLLNASWMRYLFTLSLLSSGVSILLYNSGISTAMFTKAKSNKERYNLNINSFQENQTHYKTQKTDTGSGNVDEKLKLTDGVAGSHIASGNKSGDPDPVRIRTLIGHIHNHQQSNISIAIAMGITMKAGRGKAYLKTSPEFIVLVPTFKELIPSFCRTATVGYKYHFYFAYDFDDTFFSKMDNQKLWNRTLTSASKKICPKDIGPLKAHFVRCNSSGRPAWAQSDAVVAAYRDGHDFFYRVNDDTVMVDKDWADIFISELSHMNPPFVGVVGPKHKGGNTGILTYDFTYRTHIDIFGFHYPRAFPWWYADNWVTNVYGKNRTKKVSNVRLEHTMSLKSRYKHTGSPAFLKRVLRESQVLVDKYLQKLSKMSEESPN